MAIETNVAFLEVTPPRTQDLESGGLKEFFDVLHGTHETRSLIERLVGHKKVIALEIIARRKSGIRFVLRVPVGSLQLIRHMIETYLPGSITSEVRDPMDSTSALSRVIRFKTTSHFAFSLRSHLSSVAHDPLSYVMGAMTGLKADDSIHYQVVVSPLSSRTTNRVANRLSYDPTHLTRLGGRKVFFVSRLSRLISSSLLMVPSFITSITSDSSHVTRLTKDVKPNYVDYDTIAQVQEKLALAHFSVTLRIYVSIRDHSKRKERLKELRSSLSSLNDPVGQRLQTSVTRKLRVQKNFVRRIHDTAWSMALSTSELASVFHFPLSQAVTDNLIQSLSPTLPAPVSLKNDSQLDVLIGENVHHGITTPIGLTERERQRHMYVIGGTGNGKTTMLQYMVNQDIIAGKGIALIDPHGDMAVSVLAMVPKERLGDVVYINPDDLYAETFINMLELDPRLTGDALLKRKDMITETVISVFRKIFSDDDSGGHRVEYVLRNAIHTALTVPDATLFTIYKLLNDSSYRKPIVLALKDENLKHFWTNELERAGDMQRVKMIAGITSKLGRFLFSASMRSIIEQPHSTIDFTRIIDDGKILICNLSKGLIGEDTSELLGVMILAQLQLASLERARLPEYARRPFYMYVDEFQNFATVSFMQMLSESRKYKLYLTMAEQSTAQQRDKNMVNVLLANVGTVVTFRTGSPVDEQVLLPFFAPFVKQGEIMNLPSYHFYVRLAGVLSQEPLSGVTIQPNQIMERTLSPIVFDMA